VSFLKNQSTYSDFANVFTNFAKISTDFARILSDFVRIFTKSKVLVVRLHPTSYTSDPHGILKTHGTPLHVLRNPFVEKH